MRKRVIIIALIGALLMATPAEAGYTYTEPVQGQIYTEIDAPHNEMKSYMHYKAITNKQSKQFKLQQQAYTGYYGIRMIDDRFCIALGTGYGAELGDKVDLVLENKKVIKCIVSEYKADKHTDESNRVTVHDRSVAEFIIEQDALFRKTGDVSNATEGWQSEIKKVRVLYDGLQ